MPGDGTVWIVVFMNDEDEIEIAGAYGSFGPAMNIVRDTPRSGCVELEIGRDYRNIKNFRVHTAEHPEGIDT